jgi:cardiolipin synthase
MLRLARACLRAIPAKILHAMTERLSNAYRALTEHPFVNGVLPHLLTVAGFLLALFVVARLMSERRQPGNTVAWLLVIAFIPYVGVPLYLVFGGRKIRRLAARKIRLCPVVPGAQPSAAAQGATARIVAHSGACPPVGGNRVQLLTTGEDAFAELERQIRTAQHTIHVMTFILSRDAVGRRIVALLAQRAREGVKVRLLLDALGSFLSTRGFVEPIRAAGGEVHRFMPVLPLQSRWSANLRNHRKIAVFDHRVAILGGHNLGRQYMGPGPTRRRWRDFGAVIEGPSVGLLNEIFLADWAFASGRSIDDLHQMLPAETAPAVGDSELQVVASGPDVEGDPLYEGILSIIQEATRQVWIVTPYFIPDEVLFRTLVLKARSGVQVRLVVPARSDHRIVDFARRHYLRELAAAGAEILFYGPGMNHAKLILVDERISLMGSANLDLRSLFVNFEVGVLTFSPADAHATAAWMREVFTRCRPMPELRRRRFFPTLGEELSRLLAPLL